MKTCRRFGLFMMVLVMKISVFAQPKLDLPAFKFINLKADTYILGDVKSNTESKFVIEFINAGKSPLFIYQVKSPVNFISVDWVKQPILPNKKGTITVVLKANAPLGSITRNIDIISNVTASEGRTATQINIKANVLNE